MAEVAVNYLQQKYLITQAAKKWNVPYGIAVGVYGLETDFGHNSTTSSGGAIGPFQFLPSTAKSYNYPLTNNPTPAQFAQQADAQSHYLSDLFRQTGSWDTALQHYSGGGYGLTQVNAKAQTLLHGGTFSGGGVSPNQAIGVGSVAGLGAIVGAGLGAGDAAVTGEAGAATAGSGAAAGGSAAGGLSTLARVKQGLGIAAIISVLLDPSHWLRILMVVGGILLAVIALLYMLKTQMLK